MKHRLTVYKLISKIDSGRLDPPVDFPLPSINSKLHWVVSRKHTDVDKLQGLR